MITQDKSISYNFTTLLTTLRELHGDILDQAAIEELACSIEPFLHRTHLPLNEAIAKISTNYLRDGERVQQLLNNPLSHEWQMVLTEVISFASKHRLFPTGTVAATWPDLDAYEDIRLKLHSYNFEGTLDSWISVTVVRRLRRFWRDSQALRAGGTGFQTTARRNTSDSARDLQGHDRRAWVSLDSLMSGDEQIADALEDNQPSIADVVESTELQRLVRKRVHEFALSKNDPMLDQIWNAVVEQQLKLREVAVAFNISISQVHRRVKQVQVHLQQDPDLRAWLDTNPALNDSIDYRCIEG